MSIAAMNYYWTREDTLSATELLVLLALADNANDQGESWPSHKHIAKKCRLSEVGVRKIIDRLEELGEVVVHQQTRKDGSTTSNLYRLTHWRGTKGAPIWPNRGDTTYQGGDTTYQGGDTGVSPIEPSVNQLQSPSDLHIKRTAPHIAIVKAYYGVLKEAGRTVVEDYPRQVRTAQLILQDGFTAVEVVFKTRELTKDKFWKDKPISLEKVREYLQAEPRKPIPDNGKESTQYDLFDPFEEGE